MSKSILNKLAILVMIIATTFTVCLHVAYRPNRNTRLVQLLVIAYMYRHVTFFFKFVCLLLFCCCCFFVLLFFFSFAKRAMIFDDAIYLFIYFLHFISMLLRPSPILKLFRKWAREMKKTTTLQQQTNNYHTSNVI